MAKIKPFIDKHKELVLYVLFGILCAGANWLVYIILVKALSVDLSVVSGADDAIFDMLEGESGDNIKKLVVCTFSAWFVNVIVAFITNKKWVFCSTVKTFTGVLREFITFFGAHLLTGMIEWIGIPLVVMAGLRQSIFGIEGAFAKILVSIVVMILNYVFSKLLVFKKRRNRRM